MTREYTDLTEYVIINITYELRMKWAHESTVKVQTRKNNRDGFIYSVESGQKPSLSHKDYKDPPHTVVVQYTDKIDNKEYLFEIRKLKEHKYEKWCLHIEKRKWTFEDITEEETEKEKQAMLEVIETKKRQEQEHNANIEHARKKMEDEANEFLWTHPTVKSYVDKLKLDNHDLKDKVSSLEKEVQDLNYSVFYREKEKKYQEEKNQKLHDEIDTLKDEITRLEKKKLPVWFNNSRPKATSDLISQLKYLNDT